MIDIGNFATAKYKLSDFGQIDALLITHQHADHIDPELVDELATAAIPIITNSDVAQKFPQLDAKVVTDGETFHAAGMNITARELPHCLMPDGSAGPPNTGYVVEDTFFHPGDGMKIDNLQVDNLAAPIAGPSVSLKDGVDLARSVQAKRVIPMHYHNPVFFNNPEVLNRFELPFEITILGDGESMEV